MSTSDTAADGILAGGSMSAEYVIEFYELLEAHNITSWLDGGWGVDALLEKQTRPHQDLDIAVALDKVEQIRDLLDKKGYTVFQDEMPTRIELRDIKGHRIDLHPLTFDNQGNGLQKLQDGSLGTYTAQGLSGKGLINGKAVRCLSPEIQMRFHQGYEPDQSDISDVAALHSKFGLEVPEEYLALIK
jgi:lincosamide nucleotidyltransferase A/C/D/E